MDSTPSFRELLVRDWYLPCLTPRTAALLPLSWLFGGVASARRRLHASGLLCPSPLPVPVIVVGNITAGGTGKTPLVAWLVGALQERGLRPGIVSRGYGGAHTSPRAAKVGDDPRVVGDEPLLLARAGVPVWVGRDRVAAAKGLIDSSPEVDVIVADDGLQHYRLCRAFEIVVVDGGRGFGNGALLPAGPLREPLSHAGTVDAIVVNGAQSNPALLRGIDVPIFAMELKGDLFVNLMEPARQVVAADFRGQRVHAVAGIGNPKRFFEFLRAQGLDPVCHAFADHHDYRAGDLALPGADAILMTDKDAIKCQTLADARMWRLPVTAAVGPGLIERILEKIHGPQAA